MLMMGEGDFPVPHWEGLVSFLEFNVPFSTNMAISDTKGQE